MAHVSERIVNGFKRFLPSPFTIAIILTVITAFLAWLLLQPIDTTNTQYLWFLVESWESGLWDNSGGGIYFAFQMMLMLVLGHCLALTQPIQRIIHQLVQFCTTTVNSAIIVGMSSMLMGFFNWGLGLIFGAILAREVGLKFAHIKKPLNFGLIGACAYLGMLVWHGGLSGSAPTKVMEPGYLEEMMKGIDLSPNFVIPSAIPFEETIGSSMNFVAAIVLIIAFAVFIWWIAKNSQSGAIPSIPKESIAPPLKESSQKGAEKMDTSQFIGLSIGAVFLAVGIAKAYHYSGSSSFGFIQPNFINLMLLGLSLALHRSIHQFLAGIQSAVGDISGILIQFPLYFGILGIMKQSGLIILFSDYLIEYADANTLPIYTFLSAGLVNFFVPSGGGQWAIQGPVLLQAAQELGADIPKTVMAMSYGDQLTNMLQPFWALPLLGITKLKAHEILPYTFLFFLLGGIIFLSVLFVF